MARRPLPTDVEEHLARLAGEQGRAPNTVAAYRRDLTAYCAFLAQHGIGPTEVGDELISSYLDHLHGLRRAPSSVARALASVRSLHRFLVEEERAPADPTRAVRGPRARTGTESHTLSPEEIARIIDRVAGDDAVARRDRAILEILYGSGLRISELVGLDLTDLDRTCSSIRIRSRREGARVVPLGTAARRALERWLSVDGRASLAGRRSTRDDTIAAFINARGKRLSRQGAWGIVRQRGRAAGLVELVAPHVLRNSCARHMEAAGAPTEVVDALLGRSHAPAGRHFAVSDEQLREVFEATHPRALDSPRG